MALPDTYKQVEYIQSSGTTTTGANGPYIDTGFKPKSTTRVKFKANFQSTADGPIYGAWTSSTSSRFGAWFGINPSAIAMGYGNFNGVGGYLPVLFDTDVTVEQYASGNTVYNIVDGTTVTNTATFVEPNLNMYIFARNGTTSTEKKCPMKLYYFQIYDSGTLVRDFIPVVRKADNKPGLYDLVNNIFYTNAGTGEFTYPARSGKVKKRYIGTQLVRPNKWQPSSNTLAYYPLTSATTVNDMSGNGKTFSNTNVTFGTYQGVDCAYFSGNNCQLRNTSLPDVRSTDWTVLCWSYFVWNGSTGNGNLDQILWWWGGNTGVRFDCYGSSSSNLKFLLSRCYPEYNLKNVSKWILSVSTYNATTYERNFYIDGTLQGTGSGQMNSNYVNYLTMSNTQDTSTASYKRWKGGASELILENKIWTAQEIQNYYNQTKSNYGL